MYVHLGNDVSVNEKGIIGIFDIENTSLGNDTREFLKRSEKEGNVVNVSYEMPKSFISSPTAIPISCRSAVFQVCASSISTGHAVA